MTIRNGYARAKLPIDELVEAVALDILVLSAANFVNQHRLAWTKPIVRNLELVK
ncbi:hypothetical protein KIN20_036722 [Parelaphostrongylus tenuis]|uniref:Uncharacterized protein n=1 Tax=Parelaphostrongylus tenuis TaxID=148309 RepID=A0AAD5RDJ0_PARTN|nr:hypothetical protein KIN20_036722 [Parelaphostrongylus tenuis]